MGRYSSDAETVRTVGQTIVLRGIGSCPSYSSSGMVTRKADQEDIERSNYRQDLIV